MSALLGHTMVKDPSERWPAERVRDELRRIARGETAAEATTRMEPVLAERPVAAAAPLPAPAPQRGPDGPRKAGPWGWVAALAVLAVLAGLGTWLLWPGDGQRPDAGTDARPSRSSQPSSDQPSDEPSEEPSEPSSSPPSSDGTPAEVRTFLQDYFSLVTSDPESSYAMLTPEFQDASGGYDDYSGFWSTIRSARAYDIRVDPESLTATYTIDYVTTSGRSTTQQGRLQIVQQGDGYLIADEG